jgi:methylmalonyl-CoA mutase cobalamin-binding subunit
MVKQAVSISVADDHLDKFAGVVRACKKAGLQVEEQMKAIGVVNGMIDSSKIEQLQKVKGVAHIELSRQFQIAPPESDIQ